MGTEKHKSVVVFAKKVVEKTGEETGRREKREGFSKQLFSES